MFPFVSPLPSPSDVFLFALVLCRIGGLFTALPLFGGRRLPMKVKAAAIFAITLVTYPLLVIKAPPLPADAVTLGLFVLSEVMIGLTLAFVTQLIFSAVEFSGQIIGLQMGFSIASVIDPAMGNQVQIMSVIQSLLATLFFLSLNIHHVFIHAIADSFDIIPLGGWRINEQMVKFLISATSDIFILGIRLVAPVMITLLLTSVVLGVMARAFPKMNIFMVSFPLKIGLGFIVLGMTLPLFFHVLEISFGNLSTQIITVFRLIAEGG
jgi:flagellar biosynthetic protein FliR